jgi:hypothetical protein
MVITKPHLKVGVGAGSEEVVKVMHLVAVV